MDFAVDMDLLNVLNARSADSAELEHILLNYFGKVSFVAEDLALYGGDPHQSQLMLTYKGGCPAHAFKGGGFSQDDLNALAARIQDELLTLGPVEIGRRALFTTLRIDGFYRYRDRFQLVPVPPDAPRPDMAMLATNPFLLEVSYHRSSNSMISMLRKEKTEREVELLCAVFLWLPIEHIGNYRFRWVIDPGPAPHPTSSHRQEGYHWPGDRPVRETFSDVQNIAPMEMVAPDTYYARFNYSYDDCLDLPSNISEMFDVFYSLSQTDQRRFLRASYWFHHASLVWPTSHSAAFTALVSAVEALMPPPVHGAACPTCKRRSGPGPTAQFESFVEAYASDQQTSADQRKSFYRVRSALSHGGRILDRDQRTWPGAASMSDMRKVRALSGVARAVLCKWLAGQAVAEQASSV